MRERCPVCGLRFEREEGYFLGAMIVDYTLAIVVVAILALILWSCTRWGFDKIVIWALVLFLPLLRTCTRLGRIIWIYFDQSVDPDTQ